MTAAEPLIEVELPAPVEEVWAHLRDPGFIRRWFGWEYEGLEGEIEFIFLGPPPEALAGMPEGAGFDVDDGAHTITWAYGGVDRDRFELRAEGDACVLRVTRTISPDSWDGVHDDVGEGWISFVQQLRFPLSRHRGEERRTVFTSSAVKPPTTSSPCSGWTGSTGPGPGCSVLNRGARATCGSGPTTSWR